MLSKDEGAVALRRVADAYGTAAAEDAARALLADREELQRQLAEARAEVARLRAALEEDARSCQEN